MSGWVALTRDSFKHPLFKREPVTEWEAFARLIRRAAWEDTRHRVGGELLDVARGSFFCTLRELQLEFMWKSDARVRKFLKRLENERMIERRTNAGKTHVTICNYDEYQAGERKESQAVNAPKTQDERIKETSKQINKEQGKGKGASAPKNPPLFSLFPSSVSEDVAKAFVDHRKKKRAPLNPHIIELVSRVLAEAETHGIPADAALNHAMVRGWTGLELGWLLKHFKKNGASNERPRTAHAHAAAAQTFVADSWIADARRDDEEQGLRRSDEPSGESDDFGVDSGSNDDAVVSLFSARSGREGFGGGGQGLDLGSQEVSAIGYRSGGG